MLIDYVLLKMVLSFQKWIRQLPLPLLQMIFSNMSNIVILHHIEALSGLTFSTMVDIENFDT